MNRKFFLVGFLLAGLVVVPRPLATAQVLTRSGLSTLNSASSVVAADFNRDGVIDLAVGLFGGSSGIQVFLGKGDGTFKPPCAVRSRHGPRGPGNRRPQP